MNISQQTPVCWMRTYLIACLLLTILPQVNSSSTIKIDAGEILKPSLFEAIEMANLKPGIDSLYVSGLNFYFAGSEMKKVNIEDHLVLINDVKTQPNQITEGVELNVTEIGHLEMQGFDLSSLNSKMINHGTVTLKDCYFKEGRDLTRFIHNEGAFKIEHGIFLGDASGPIIRNAHFRIGSYVVL